MATGAAKQIDPVLVLSTGRCGSTMVSEVLNTHPDVLSLSEFFISLGMKSLIRKRLGGKALWGICCRHSPGLRATLLSGNRDRIRYPRDKLCQRIAFIDPSLVDDAWLDTAAGIPRPEGRAERNETWSPFPLCWCFPPAAAVRRCCRTY